MWNLLRGWGAYSAPPDLLPGFKGPICTSKEKEGKGREGVGITLLENVYSFV